MICSALPEYSGVQEFTHAMKWTWRFREIEAVRTFNPQRDAIVPQGLMRLAKHKERPMTDTTHTVIFVNIAYADLVDALIAETGNIIETEQEDLAKKYIDDRANYGNIDWLVRIIHINPDGICFSRPGEVSPVILKERPYAT